MCIRRRDWGASAWGSAVLAGIGTACVQAQCPPVETAELVPGDSGVAYHFGSSVAIHGDRVLCGARGADGALAGSGAAYVFSRTAAGWIETAKLFAPDSGAADSFGGAVALHGSTAVIGAFGADHYVGAAYVFVHEAGSWTQQAKLTAFDGGSLDHFGWSVAVDGDTAVVGAWGHSDFGVDTGAAYVFVRVGADWMHEATLVADDAQDGDAFGGTVCIQGDTVLVAAPSEDHGGKAAVGAAYVFTRSAGAWTQQAKLVAPDGAAGDRFGRCALDGDTAVIASPYAEAGDLVDAGAAYVFRNLGANWVLEAKLTPADVQAYDRCGASVTIDGDVIAVGADLADGEWFPDLGAAWVFLRRGDNWTQVAKLTAHDGQPGDYFGGKLRLDAGTIVCGAHMKNQPGLALAGAAYTFELLPLADVDCDGDADPADYAVFVGAYGRCAGDAAYNPFTDYDRDGCTTLVDYQAWLGYYPGGAKACRGVAAGGMQNEECRIQARTRRGERARAASLAEWRGD